MTSTHVLRRTRPRLELGSLAWSTTDRTLAVAAHAAIGFGFLGIGFVASAVIAAVVWLVSRRRPHVAFHGEQAGVYQLVVLVINAVVITAWVALGVAMFGQRLPIPGFGPLALTVPAAPWLVTLWILAVPIFAVWYVGTILYGLYGAVQVALGRRFWYPVIGPWASRRSARSTRGAGSARSTRSAGVTGETASQS
jgi:hypothetical protein